MTPEKAEKTAKLIDLSAFIRNHFPADQLDNELIECIDYLEQQREELKNPIDLQLIEEEPADAWEIH